MSLHTLLAWVTALLAAVSLFTHTVAGRLLLLAAGIVLAAAVLVHSREARPLPPVWIPFALWAAWAALSIAWSIEPERSAKEWRNEAFYTGAVLWVSYVAGQARAAPRIFLGVLAFAAAGVCLVALCSALGELDAYQRGLHGGSGNHSSALLTLIPCAAVTAWYAARARWPRWVLVCACGLVALFLVSAYATLNRTIWLGIALQLILLGTFGSRLVPTRRMKIAAGIAALAAIVVLGAAITLNIHAQRETRGTPSSFTEDARLALWPEILERIEERPVTGYGFGRGLLRRPLQEELGSVDLWHAHNFFLEAWLQTGLPGLLLLVLLLAAIAREGWRAARERDERVAACGMVLLAIIAGMLVRNMTDTLFVRQNALLFWSVVGTLLGFICSRSSAAAASTTSKG